MHDDEEKKSKINTRVEKFIIKNIEILKTRRMKSRIMWKLFYMITIIINIAILSISIYLIYLLLHIYFNHSNNGQTLFKEIGPQLLVVSITTLSFPLSLITVIYRSRMHAAKYKNAFESIQYITMKYIERVDAFDSSISNIKRENIYKKQIKEITREATAKNINKFDIKNIKKWIMGDN